MQNRECVRYRVSFYASTPAYRPVMELHGWEDLADKLLRMTQTGQWKKMAAEVPDEVLDEVCIYTTYDKLTEAIEARFGGVSDTVEVGFEADTDVEVAEEVVSRVHAIATGFQAPLDRYA